MHLGAEPSGEFRLYRYLMTRTLSAARALGKEPLGAHFRPGSRGGVASPDETLAAARRAFREGFRGAFCATPEQVAAVTTGFTPPQDEVAQARRILAEFQIRRQKGLARPVIGGRTYDDFKVGCLQQMVDFAEACTVRDAEKPLVEGKGVSQ
jgi:citrate lyase beta subunit